MHTVETFLHRTRYWLATIGLLLIVYCQAYLMMAAPADLGFGFLWQPDNQLKVVEVLPEHLSASQLAVGDFIVAIDGRTLRQTRPTFVPPIRPNYELEVERDGEHMLVQLELDDLRPETLLSTTMVSLLSWTVGLILLLYRIQADRNAFRLGMIFIYLGTLLTIIQGSVWGVPGMWISHGATHFSFFAFVMLGMLPQRSNFGRNQRRIVQVIFTVSAIVATIGLVEALFLFPTGRSLMAVTGFSLVRTSYLLLAAGMLVSLVLLVVRLVRSAATYHRRQLAILLFFVALGVLPAVLLTLVPQIVIGRMLAPRLLTFSMLLFVPLGYLFVVFRQGYLKLDYYIGRILVGVLLVLIVFTLYSTLWDVLTERFGGFTGDGNAALAVGIFAIAILLAKPIQNSIQTIFYGREHLTAQTIARIVTDISARPHRMTLQQVIEQVAAELNVEQSVLLLEMEDDDWTPLAQHNVALLTKGDVGAIELFSVPLLKVQDEHALFGRFEWSKLLLPVMLNGKQIGVWLLSNPRPSDAFDARLLTKLTQVANMIAVSSRAIQIFESTNKVAGEILHSHMLEQHTLATQIHDYPLSDVIKTRSLLKRWQKSSADEPVVKEAIDSLQGVIHDLRKVCKGLRIESFDQGLDTLAKDVIVNAVSKVPTLQVQRRLDESLMSVQASTTTKMALAHILRESLNNAARHANAEKVDITVDCVDDTIEIEVQDDGEGGAAIAEAAVDIVQPKDHLGLYFMYQWARRAQGLLSVKGNDLGGVTVTAKLKLQS